MKFKIIKHSNKIGDEYYTIKKKTKPFGIWITMRVKQNYLWDGPIEWLVCTSFIKRGYEYDRKFDSLDRCNLLIENTISMLIKYKQFLKDKKFKHRVIKNYKDESIDR